MCHHVETVCEEHREGKAGGWEEEPDVVPQYMNLVILRGVLVTGGGVVMPCDLLVRKSEFYVDTMGARPPGAQ